MRVLFCSDMTLHQEPITQWSGTKSQNNEVLMTPTSTDFKLRSFHLHDHASLFQNLYSIRNHIQDHYFSWQYLCATSCWLTIIQYLAPTADQPPTHTHIIGDSLPGLYASLFIINIEFKERMLQTLELNFLWTDNFMGCLLKKWAQTHSA